MRNSLQNLLDEFPYFFDKRATSNFYKSQSVTNAQFQRMYQSIFEVVESFKLDKNCLIWKEQSEPYKYVINFVANYPHLKNVTCYKNDDVIYTESFSYDDNISKFDYSYEGNTINDVENNNRTDIIPQHQFKIIVETFDEFEIVKGYPENDDTQGNEYDHDPSLDEIGALHNIPRKQYLIVDEDLYSATEPPYNDRSSEDDYHYMQRILNYLLLYHITPLPVLEIWKLYGITATMENREKLLLKVFDLEKHPNFIDERKDSNGDYISKGDRWFSGTLNEETGEITAWTPEAWEHQDKFCDYSSNLGKYFFVKVSTKIPVKNQSVIFYFKFVDSLAHDLKEQCTVDILLDNRVLYSNLTVSQKTIDSSEIPRDKDNIFTIIGRDSTGEIISSQDVIISVRGCNNGDFYVNPSTGNDSNDGKTRSTAFKTIQKAVNSINGDKNFIILLSGNYEITSPIIVNKNCTIMGCGSVLVENLSENLFFTVAPDISLILQDFTVQYKGDICNISDTTFTNHNGNYEPANVLLLFTNAPIIVMTRLDVSFITRNYCVGDTVNFTGKLLDKYGDVMASKTISVTDGKNTVTCTTNSSGVYTGTITAEKIGDLTLNASYAGEEGYKPSVATANININLRLRDLLLSYDYVVMDLEYDETTSDWNYLTKPVSEITKLADLNGAILNLQYNGYDVQFERFHSYSNNNYLSKTDMTKLRGLLVGIAYDDYNVQYMNAHIFGESSLTLTTEATSYNVGDTITFTGTLLDKYDDPIPNKVVIVNNQRCTTNSSGVYTGSITATAPGNMILNATYEGDMDYDRSTSAKNITVLISLASVLSDYDYVVMDLEYDEETTDWNYSTIDVEEITNIGDLNNAVKNLTKVGDNIIFERFTTTSTNQNITKSELESLTGLLVGIVYDDYEIKYTKI